MPRRQVGHTAYDEAADRYMQHEKGACNCPAPIENTEYYSRKSNYHNSNSEFHRISSPGVLYDLYHIKRPKPEKVTQEERFLPECTFGA
jgi:hypothetical protein